MPAVNVFPMPTSPAVDNAGTTPSGGTPLLDKHTEEGSTPSTPSSPILSSSIMSLASLKDQRAYERDRHRTKKAAEVKQMKARKQGWFRAKLTGSGTGTITGGPRASKWQHDHCLTTDDVVTPEGTTPIGSTHVVRKDSLGQTAQGHQTEFSLADLIPKAKVRKSQAGDFEVVPRVRSVIALDDTVSHDLHVDEPWEYIQVEDKDVASVTHKPQSISYAHAVLSMSK